MRRIVVLVALVCTCGITLPQQKPRPKTEATLAEQKECYDQAQKFQGKHTQIIQHYSKRQNVCFIRTYALLYDDENNFKGVNAEVRDAFENTLYGTCMVGEKSTVLMCWLSDPNGGEEKTFQEMQKWLDYTMATYFSKHY